MAAHDTTAVAEQERWSDENGIHWTRQPDGSLMFFDAVSGEWKYQ